MSDQYSQEDAPEDVFYRPQTGRLDPTRNRRQREWQRRNPLKVAAKQALYRKRHARAYREYMARYMANRRAVAKDGQSDA